MVTHSVSLELGTNLETMRQTALILLVAIGLALSVQGFKEEEFKVRCATIARESETNHDRSSVCYSLHVQRMKSSDQPCLCDSIVCVSGEQFYRRVCISQQVVNLLTSCIVLCRNAVNQPFAPDYEVHKAKLAQWNQSRCRCKTVQ